MTAKTIAGFRIDSTEPCSGLNRQYATFARFSEPRAFRVFQHYWHIPDMAFTTPKVRHAVLADQLPLLTQLGH